MRAGTKDAVRVERMAGLDDFGVWQLSQPGPDGSDHPQLDALRLLAARIFRDQPEVASVSIVSSLTPGDVASVSTGTAVAISNAAALPLCFLNEKIADLIGLADRDGSPSWPVERFRSLVARATLKGLVHWCVRVPVGAAADALPQTAAVSPLADHPSLVPRPSASGHGGRASISLGIDAAWLLGGESGAQVFVFEMIREMAQRPEVSRVVFLSDRGGVPQSLAAVPKVSGASWAEITTGRLARLDIVHRPYQPGSDVDYRRYRRVASCVALTVLDFIAYDNPAYHESGAAWQQYQQDFAEQVCLADQVFAISRYVGSRIDRQFAHRLVGPVRAIHLGTDHMRAPVNSCGTAGVSPSLALLERKRFLLVLGNDFEHKNRDFAVRVFREMATRGYDGMLVLAGFHLDLGSSFDHELANAGPYASRILRTGAVSSAEKTWLLQHAAVVLYPTSSEGFGLIPFEAAALGTPTAFVRFGSLREILPAVSACTGWHVRLFADHVFNLIANPQEQLEQIRAAASPLTWESCVDQTLETYQQMLADDAAWRAARPMLPGNRERARRTARHYLGRALRKLQRLAGQS
jgi:glycosyltransferase involved in cell wall biosynthesis